MDGIAFNAGTLLVQTGTAISNDIVLNGGALAQTFGIGASLADAITATSDLGGMQPVRA
ncbi:MAG: hypothetical protein WC003_15810 [Terrimicrobiaceae bacterium]